MPDIWKRWALNLAVVILVGVTAYHSAIAQDPGRFARWVYQDSGALLKEVGPRIPLYTLSATTFLLPASSRDQYYLERIQDGYSGTWGTYLDVTNELGGPLAVIPLIGIFEASLFTGDTRFQDASFTSLQAWVYSGVLAGALKTIFGRSRPESGGDPDDYGLFSGHRSYPSGHTTAAFAIVTPWVMYYPHLATYGLFALSTSTAIARIALDKHWPTDVIAGAALGYFTARWLVHRHAGDDPGSGVTFTPIVGPDAAGIQIDINL